MTGTVQTSKDNQQNVSGKQNVSEKSPGIQVSSNKSFYKFAPLAQEEEVIVDKGQLLSKRDRKLTAKALESKQQGKKKKSVVESLNREESLFS